MANSYYQTITKPKLYVSYPLWQYANGALTDLATNYWIKGGDTWVAPDETLINMIQYIIQQCKGNLIEIAIATIGILSILTLLIPKDSFFGRCLGIFGQIFGFMGKLIGKK